MYDRDLVVAATNSSALADDLLGLHKGSDRSPRWPCPNPDHHQPGRTLLLAGRALTRPRPTITRF